MTPGSLYLLLTAAIFISSATAAPQHLLSGQDLDSFCSSVSPPDDTSYGGANPSAIAPSSSDADPSAGSRVIPSQDVQIGSQTDVIPTTGVFPKLVFQPAIQLYDPVVSNFQSGGSYGDDHDTNDYDGDSDYGDGSDYDPDYTPDYGSLGDGMYTTSDDGATNALTRKKKRSNQDKWSGCKSSCLPSCFKRELGSVTHTRVAGQTKTSSPSPTSSISTPKMKRGTAPAPSCLPYTGTQVVAPPGAANNANCQLEPVQSECGTPTSNVGCAGFKKRQASSDDSSPGTSCSGTSGVIGGTTKIVGSPSDISADTVILPIVKIKPHALQPVPVPVSKAYSVPVPVGVSVPWSSDFGDSGADPCDWNQDGFSWGNWGC
ncbi:hypothetical protein BGZ99_000981 [Dissophora globulifera]|uniref:Uncharacterized protein n=1 Tax=Dissophora globulifera TaxID=979702 RepID=A0A9P6R0Z4_9FUNG|nr:hypothetical protein BGZ99_000981 [Dissophora globulifera]